MPKRSQPRKGSMQFWPRKRARRHYARVRSWASAPDAKPLGFAGYKAGMAHIIATDNRKFSQTKGQDISMPVTIVECPPLKVSSIKFYKKTPYGLKVTNEIMGKVDKELERKLPLPKKTNESELAKINPDEYADITLLVYTQPKLTGLGKKKPDVFEIGLGGNIKTKFDYAKNMLGKEITVGGVFQEGQQVDIHAVSKGKGFQGPVKRFGVTIRSHKAEKTKRGPASLGSWCGQGHMMYRVAHAGQMGYHTRLDYNKQIIKIEKDPSKVNPAGGFNRYGIVNNPCILIKGSVTGAKKRIVRLCKATRENKRMAKEAPAIQQIILSS
ncbi:50S ribosomal protein L3 [Candidatus Woesearchaeota archaeon CG10_big_fil_rev_8_21_14_0_10_44_13]|nr:MAG: 50S ribosomal protein L3 [Candidatus Woesearchaeota archaeon CG10_big_fil_rev_8_21_14_0_10_44_13]